MYIRNKHFLTLGGSIALLVTGACSSDTNPTVDMVQTHVEGADAQNDVNGIPEEVLTRLVAVANPDSGETDDSATDFLEGPEGSFVSMSSEDVYDSVYKFENDFDAVGANNTFATSADYSMVIAQKLTFHTDSVMIWDGAYTGPKAYKWKSHPAKIKVDAGTIAVIYYTSKDGGTTWEGSVKVVN